VAPRKFQRSGSKMVREQKMGKSTVLILRASEESEGAQFSASRAFILLSPSFRKANYSSIFVSKAIQLEQGFKTKETKAIACQ
jgi:hypothetical protein